MTDDSTDVGDTDQTAHQASPEKLVYLMPEQGMIGSMEDEISVKELWDVLWKGKWPIIVITALFAVGSVAYALLATEWYRAEVLLAPSEVESTPSVVGQLGGLAALAGVSVGGGGTAEAVATLKSRDLAREFIESNELMSVLLYEDWDEAGQDWKAAAKKDVPDIRDAVRFFHEEALTVREDRESGLVTVAVEWVEPNTAADWASKLVQLANDRLRQRALQDAERNVGYLQSELGSTSVVTLQQSIGRLLETEMQKLMLAKGNEEFAFRVVDTAAPAKKPARPRRVIVTVLGTLLGGVFAVFLVFIRHAIRGNEYN